MIINKLSSSVEVIQNYLIQEMCTLRKKIIGVAILWNVGSAKGINTPEPEVHRKSSDWRPDIECLAIPSLVPEWSNACSTTAMEIFTHYLLVRRRMLMELLLILICHFVSTQSKLFFFHLLDFLYASIFGIFGIYASNIRILEKLDHA